MQCAHKSGRCPTMVDQPNQLNSLASHACVPSLLFACVLCRSSWYAFGGSVTQEHMEQVCSAHDVLIAPARNRHPFLDLDLVVHSMHACCSMLLLHPLHVPSTHCQQCSFVTGLMRARCLRVQHVAAMSAARVFDSCMPRVQPHTTDCMSVRHAHVVFACRRFPRWPIEVQCPETTAVF